MLRLRTRFSAAPCAPHAAPLPIEPLARTRPLLYRERRLYLKGIQDALAGVELARVTLAGACRRLQEGDSRPLKGPGADRRL